MKVAQVVHELGEARSQGVTRVGVSGVPMYNAELDLAVRVRGGLNTKKMAPMCRVHGRRAKHRDSGSCLSSSCPETTELRLSLYVSGNS